MAPGKADPETSPFSMEGHHNSGDGITHFTPLAQTLALLPRTVTNPIRVLFFAQAMHVDGRALLLPVRLGETVRAFSGRKNLSEGDKEALLFGIVHSSLQGSHMDTAQDDEAYDCRTILTKRRRELHVHEYAPVELTRETVPEINGKDKIWKRASIRKGYLARLLAHQYMSQVRNGPLPQRLVAKWGHSASRSRETGVQEKSALSIVQFSGWQGGHERA